MNNSVYERMLEHRFYLYRPWIPICKSIEAEVIRRFDFTGPVLDIGCGNGLFGSLSFKEKIDVGLDYDKNAVEEARKRSIYKEVILGDARALPFEKSTFNTIVSVCALEHIPELDKVLSSVRNVLRESGSFVFTVPSEEFGDYLFGSTLLKALGQKVRAKKYGDEKNRKSGHLHVYSPKKWKEILKEKGLEVDSINHIFPKEAVFLWSFFHSLPFRILFLPFRLLRDTNIKVVDDLLRVILRALLSRWLRKKSRMYASGGGYLLIEARG